MSQFAELATLVYSPSNLVGYAVVALGADGQTIAIVTYGPDGVRVDSEFYVAVFS